MRIRILSHFTFTSSKSHKLQSSSKAKPTSITPDSDTSKWTHQQSLILVSPFCTLRLNMSETVQGVQDVQAVLSFAEVRKRYKAAVALRIAGKLAECRVFAETLRTLHPSPALVYCYIILASIQEDWYQAEVSGWFVCDVAFPVSISLSRRSDLRIADDQPGLCVQGRRPGMRTGKHAWTTDLRYRSRRAVMENAS